MNVKEYFKNGKIDQNHYLKIAQNEKSQYLQEFFSAIEILHDKLDSKKIKSILKDKLLLREGHFDVKKFIQGACEISVASYFAEKENFNVDVEVNPQNKKDVDCQFSSNGFKYNIEIKCPTFDKKEKIDLENGLKLQSVGRINNYNDISFFLGNILTETTNKPFHNKKKMDNNLKDYLLSAHDKFNDNCQDSELNILLIGCDDEYDMNQWADYLTKRQGLFTPYSYVNNQLYNNVDVVVLTNLYFKHHNFHTKRVRESWSLNNTLNLSITNPFPKTAKNPAIISFHNEIKNYNNEINEYPIYPILDFLKIPHFVHEVLEKEGIYLFQEKK